MRTYDFCVNNKDYSLKYTFNSICDLEEEAKIGLTSLLSSEKVGLNTMRLILWAGLKWKEHGITKQRVGDLIQKFIEEGGDYSELCSKAANLIVNSINNKSETLGE
jgi:hypothetical protein